MINVTWSLLIPTVIAIIIVNAIITVFVTYVKGQTRGRKLGLLAIMIGSLLLFISLFCILVVIMYGTPARFLFEGIDRLINGVVSGLPKMLVVFWFIVPLAIAYLIYAGMAAFYEHKRKAEFNRTTQKKKNIRPSKVKTKQGLFHRSSVKKQRPKKAKKTVLGTLDSLVTQTGIDKAIAFRRFINNSPTGLCATKYGEQYWIVAHDGDELEELRSQIPELLGDSISTSYPAVINATETSASIDSEQEAINKFRKLTRGVK